MEFGGTFSFCRFVSGEHAEEGEDSVRPSTGQHNYQDFLIFGSCDMGVQMYLMEPNYTGQSPR